jgi:3-hexulose-6-phosphate synthase
VAEQVKNYVDIIELGTPLIKSIGEHRLIKRAKKYKKEIFADLKTMDAGEYESTPAFKLGAQYAAVLGVSSNETVKGVIKAAKESNGKNAGKKSKAHAKGKEAVVDLISCPDKKKKLLELNKIGAKNFAIHTGLDEQSQGMNPLHELQLCSEVKGVNLFVAGGIKLETIDTVMQYHPRVVIVGGAITRAKSPKEAARALKKRITELEI